MSADPVTRGQIDEILTWAETARAGPESEEKLKTFIKKWPPGATTGYLYTKISGGQGGEPIGKVAENNPFTKVLLRAIHDGNRSDLDPDFKWKKGFAGTGGLPGIGAYTNFFKKKGGKRHTTRRGKRSNRGRRTRFGDRK